MDEKALKAIAEQTEGIVSTQLENFQEEVKGMVSKEAVEAAKQTVEKLAAERAAFGVDRTGLTEEQKTAFADMARAVNGIHTKASEELTSATNARGGYLVPTEVADAILRIAASTGIIAKQAKHWPMGSEQLDIPNYTGAVLEGAFL
ncbi:phage major capsid protein, partial [Candidatus Woesearchaeota archaeon]